MMMSEMALRERFDMVMQRIDTMEVRIQARLNSLEERVRENSARIEAEIARSVTERTAHVHSDTTRQLHELHASISKQIEGLEFAMAQIEANVTERVSTSNHDVTSVVRATGDATIHNLVTLLTASQHQNVAHNESVINTLESKTEMFAHQTEEHLDRLQRDDVLRGQSLTATLSELQDQILALHDVLCDLKK